MKLARKIALALIAAVLVVMGAYAWFQIHEEVILFETDLEATERAARALRLTVQNIWRQDGEHRARQAVEEIADVVEDVDVRWVQLGAPAGDPHHFDLPNEDVVVLRAGSVRRVLRTTGSGEVRRVTYIPMAPGEPTVLEVSQPLRREMSFIRLGHTAILVATTVIVLACGAVSLALGWWLVGRPVRLLRDKARRAGEGDFSGRVGLRQRDELGELAAEIDAMCESIAAANARLAAETEAKVLALEQMRHAERLATVGQLASGVAHELGTPLNVVSARAKMIAADEQSGAQARDHARVIAEQSTRMTEIIHQLLNLARRRGPRVGSADLAEIARRTLQLLEPSARARRVSLVLEEAAGGEPMVVGADPGQIQQTLANVILNGIQSMPDGGRLGVRLERRRAQPPARFGGGEGDYCCVEVADEGHGIDPADLPHVFEPFFTTKGPGEGTGLGLSVAEGIVVESGGWIGVTSEPGKGSRFAIHLPPAAGARAARAEVAS